MFNIETVVLRKYGKKRKYESLGNGIFKDLKHGRFVVTLCFELEENDGFQYPLEDILDKYSLSYTNHVKRTEVNGRRFLEVEFEDRNDSSFSNYKSIEQVALLAGKRVYNRIDNGLTKLAVD